MPRALCALVLSFALFQPLVAAAQGTQPNGLPPGVYMGEADYKQAPADKIYPLIVDLKGWASWSPYEKKDPNMKRTFSGAQSGKGAIYEWNGDKNVGHGRMEIIDAAAPSKVVIKLDFFSPFEAHNTAEFTMTPQGDATNVTWAMYGPNVFMGKVMQVFMNMDKMVGTDFEAGLQALKARAEK